MAKFQIIKDFDRPYHFKLKLDSGDVVLYSIEGVASRTVCEDLIEQVKINSKFAQRYSRLSDEQGSYFILKDVNNNILGRSESYAYWLDMESSIAAIRSYADDAELEEKEIYSDKELV